MMMPKPMMMKNACAKNASDSRFHCLSVHLAAQLPWHLATSLSFLFIYLWEMLAWASQRVVHGKARLRRRGDKAGPTLSISAPSADVACTYMVVNARDNSAPQSMFGKLLLSQWKVLMTKVQTRE